MDLSTGNFISDLERWRDFFLNIRSAKGRADRTLTIYQGVIDDFIEFGRQHQGQCQMQDINLGYMAGYFNEKLTMARDKKIKFGKTTHSLHYDVLKSFLSFITEQNHDSFTLGRGMKELRVKPEIKQKIGYSRDEYQRVLNNLEIAKIKGRREPTTYRNALIFKIVLFTGIRAAEMAGLCFKDVEALTHIQKDTEGKEERYNIFRFTVKGKGGKTRAVALEYEAIDEEMSYFTEKLPNDAPIAFSSLRDKALSPAEIGVIFSRLAKQSSVNRRGAHILRHTYAQDLVDRGENLHTISLMLGHSSPAVTSKFYAGKAEKSRLGASIRVGESRRNAIKEAKDGTKDGTI